MLGKSLALIDLHTLVLLFISPYVGLEYLLAGSLIFIVKGLYYVLFAGDMVSLLDVLFGFLLIMYIVLSLPLIFGIVIFIYLFYKSAISLSMY